MFRTLGAQMAGQGLNKEKRGMDPTANLEEQRRLAEGIIALADSGERTEIESLALSLAEHVQALDQRLCGGGFLPKPWQHEVKEEKFCRLCGQRITITDAGVSHHLTEEDEIDHDQDADHVAVAD